MCLTRNLCERCVIDIYKSEGAVQQMVHWCYVLQTATDKEKKVERKKSLTASAYAVAYIWDTNYEKSRKSEFLFACSLSSRFSEIQRKQNSSDFQLLYTFW